MQLDTFTGLQFHQQQPLLINGSPGGATTIQKAARPRIQGTD